MPKQRELDARTGPFEPYEDDHTALVHVLWAAERAGLTLARADDLAQHIMCSRWFAAVRADAAESGASRDTAPADAPDPASAERRDGPV